jgi:hypothetical protein
MLLVLIRRIERRPILGVMVMNGRSDYTRREWKTEKKNKEVILRWSSAERSESISDQGSDHGM